MKLLRKISGQNKFGTIFQMIVTLTDIVIKRYIEQLVNVTFDKDLRENRSMGKTKIEKLDNITTHGGLVYFKQARHDINILFLKSISTKPLQWPLIDNLQLTVGEVVALYRYLKEVLCIFFMRRWYLLIMSHQVLQRGLCHVWLFSKALPRSSIIQLIWSWLINPPLRIQKKAKLF